MILKDRMNRLNKNYSGSFRQLTSKEVEMYSKRLNKKDSEWYEPYAIREATNDLVCKYDNPRSAEDFLFVKIK